MLPLFLLLSPPTSFAGLLKFERSLSVLAQTVIVPRVVQQMNLDAHQCKRPKNATTKALMSIQENDRCLFIYSN